MQKKAKSFNIGGKEYAHLNEIEHHDDEHIKLAEKDSPLER